MACFFLFCFLFYVFLFIETRSQVAEVGLHVAETDLKLLIPLPLPPHYRDLQIYATKLDFYVVAVMKPRVTIE